MAFNFGALLTGVNRGLAGYRQGQMAGEDQRLEQEAQAREMKRREAADLFSQWAQRESLGRQDKQLELQEQYRRDQLGYTKEQAEANRIQQAMLQAERLADARRLQQERLDTQAREGERDRASREALARLAASLRAPTAPRTQAVQRDDGSWEIIGMDKIGPTGVQGRVPGATVQRISPKDMDDLAALQSQARQAEDALRLAETSKRWAGPWDAAVRQGRNILQKPDKEANDAAAAYARVTTPILTGQFGAALTKLEEARIAPYIPDLRNSNEQVAAAALRAIAKELRLIMRERVQSRKAGGFDTSQAEALLGQWESESAASGEDAERQRKLNEVRKKGGP